MSADYSQSISIEAGYGKEANTLNCFYLDDKTPNLANKEIKNRREASRLFKQQHQGISPKRHPTKKPCVRRKKGRRERNPMIAKGFFFGE